ncbi:MAG: DUF2975 domain-containing protein [Flavobacterium sp.]
MKYHLNILMIALRIIIFVLAIMILYNCAAGVGIITEQSKDAINAYFDMYHTSRPHNNTPLFSAIFISFYIFLLVYLLVAAIKLYRVFGRFENGYMFYDRQGAELRKIGAAMIIFAKGRYLTFCVMGAVIYGDIFVFFTQAPIFLALYLIGKIFLVMSYVSAEGELIREENDLTV